MIFETSLALYHSHLQTQYSRTKNQIFNKLMGVVGWGWLPFCRWHNPMHFYNKHYCWIWIKITMWIPTYTCSVVKLIITPLICCFPPLSEPTSALLSLEIDSGQGTAGLGLLWWSAVMGIEIRHWCIDGWVWNLTNSCVGLGNLFW